MPLSQRSRLRAGAACLASLALVISGTVVASTATAALVPAPIESSGDGATLSLTPLGTYETGLFDESGAEIVAAHGDRLFVVSAAAGSVSVLDYSDPTAMSEQFAISSDGVANSVAVRADGLGVIAFEAPVKTDPGHLVFFDANATDAASAVLGEVTVGALPDMVAISADGTRAVVANEAEPADDFSLDPEGSISVIGLPTAIAAPAQDAVRTADFHAFEEGGTATLDPAVRVFGPTPEAGNPVSRNLEPEYATIVGDTAYVSLQEANAIAEVDLVTATVTAIRPLEPIDYATHALDPSDRDGGISIRSFAGLKGLPMPDGIASYTVGGQTYLVTANEGDAREWGTYVEGARVKDLGKGGRAPVCADSPAAAFTGDADLGRLNVTTASGLDTTKNCYSELYSFGTRSFSIWTPDGERVFDSGSDFEEITAAANPSFFNANHTESNLEGRSDDKGPEPESVALGTLSGRTYAFVGLERVGGIMVYDITSPDSTSFVTYLNNRDFAVSVDGADDPSAVLSSAGDLGPEGVTFIPAASSATGTPLLAVANEVSGTTTLFSITDALALTNTVPPTVTGNADVTRTLTATSGEWNLDATYAYQWLRDGQPISGATAATYQVRLADQGRSITVRVTATGANGSAAADSAPVVVRYPALATASAGSLVVSTSMAATVTVRVIANGGATAEGQVTVKVAGKSVIGTLSNGVAKIAVGKLSRGIHAITVTYAGSAIVSPTVGLGVVLVR